MKYLCGQRFIFADWAVRNINGTLIERPKKVTIFNNVLQLSPMNIDYSDNEIIYKFPKKIHAYNGGGVILADLVMFMAGLYDGHLNYNFKYSVERIGGSVTTNITTFFSFEPIFNPFNFEDIPYDFKEGEDLRTNGQICTLSSSGANYTDEKQINATLSLNTLIGTQSPNNAGGGSFRTKDFYGMILKTYLRYFDPGGGGTTNLTGEHTLKLDFNNVRPHLVLPHGFQKGGGVGEDERIFYIPNNHYYETLNSGSS